MPATQSDAAEQVNEVEVVRDVRIPTGDPEVALSADLFRPAGSVRSPALVTVLPYRRDALAGLGHDERLRWFGARGYACLLVDFRGTGFSDGAVGMQGHSYGAIMSLRTAAPPRALVRRGEDVLTVSSWHADHLSHSR